MSVMFYAHKKMSVMFYAHKKMSVMFYAHKKMSVMFYAHKKMSVMLLFVLVPAREIYSGTCNGNGCEPLSRM